VVATSSQDEVHEERGIQTAEQSLFPIDRMKRFQILANLIILMSIQLFEEVVSKWNNCGARER
jgi:hypothetical protein